MPRLIAILTPVLLALIAGGVLAYWWRLPADRPVELRVPVPDDTAAGQDALPNAGARGTLTRGPGAAADLPGHWPGFRGPDRDGVSRSGAALARSWPANGPRRLWALDVGEGYAGAAVRDGRVYLLDYDATAQADAVRCLSLADGAEIWRYAYPMRVKRNHGMSRTVPAVTDEFVITLGPRCHVVCLDARDGTFQWARDLVADFDAAVPEWYAGQCPLVDGDRLILAPGGKALMVALDLRSGEILWQAANPRQWQMTHTSIEVMELAGRKMYVYAGSGGVAGIDAHTGEILWDTTAWRISIATIASPVHVGDGRLFLAGGYGAGAMMLQVEPAGEGFGVRTLYKLPPTTFGATQHTPILHDGHIFGVRPDGRMTRLSLDGKVVWASPPGTTFGLGPFMIHDGRVLALDDNGTLTLAEAAAEAWRPLAQARVLDGPEAWGPMALAGTRLIVRDLNRMVCLELAP